MIVASLVLSFFLLVLVNLIVGCSSKPTGWVIAVCVGFLAGIPFLNLFLPVVSLVATLSLIGLWGWRISGGRPASFRWLSYAALGLTSVATLVEVARVGWEYDWLRTRFPMESMEGRLPARGFPSTGGDLTSGSRIRLLRLEEEIGEEKRRGRWLRMLHEHSVELFTERVGFGVGRMREPYPTEEALVLRPGEKLAQPGCRTASNNSPGEWNQLPWSDDEFPSNLHSSSVADFVNSRGFGYFRDQRHVAGFQSHRFSKVPFAHPQSELQTLDLVGMLHDEPLAYDSRFLPNMDELKGVPTRPLDKFETVGLNTLQSGGDLMIVRNGATTRMLGAIRASRQCVACHQVARGTLLGAFSYTLR